jgi:hypothetical protein
VNVQVRKQGKFGINEKSAENTGESDAQNQACKKVLPSLLRPMVIYMPIGFSERASSKLLRGRMYSGI